MVCKGGKVAENDVLNLIDLLMNELLKLDAIMGDGDVKLQRKMQVLLCSSYLFFHEKDFIVLNQFFESFVGKKSAKVC